MTQKNSESLQFLGLYQLENLQRQQAKFFLVVIAESTDQVPVHPLLKSDFVLPEASVVATLDREIKARQLPAWWPVVLVSETGASDRGIADQLSNLGLSNIFSYKDGWAALIAGR